MKFVMCSKNIKKKKMQLQGNKTALDLSFQISTSIPQL